MKQMDSLSETHRNLAVLWKIHAWHFDDIEKILGNLFHFWTDPFLHKSSSNAELSIDKHLAEQDS